MSVNSRAEMDAVTSLAATTGMFDAVTGHEPKAAPARTGVTCSVFFMNMRPVQSSGLNSVSVRLELWARCYTSMLQEPQDSIDPRVLDAADALFSAIIGKYLLGQPDTRYVDIFGSDGEGLTAEFGYLEQDKAVFRTIDVKIPILINDAYAEVA